MNSDIMFQNSAIPRLNVRLSIFILVFFLLLVFLRNFLPQFRHLVYLIFPVTFFLVFIGNEGVVRLENRRKNLLFLGISWVVIIIFSLLFNIAAISFSRYLKEFYFLTASIFSAVFFYSFANIKNVETGFKIILILSGILIPIAYHQQIIDLLDFDVIDFLIHSTSETETILSYFLGLMALYFFLKGQLLYFLVSLVLVLIGSKRGVYLGLVFCIMAYYVFRPLSGVFKKNPSSTAIFFTVCNLIIAFLIFSLVKGNFDQLIIDVTGIPPNSFFKGRIELYKVVLNYLGGLPFFPKGLGFTNGLLLELNFQLDLMHSDLLKFFIEFGLLLGSILIFLMFRISLRSYNSFIVLLYYNFNFLVGNITIYLEFMFFFYIVLFYFLIKEDQTANTGGKQIEK